jgi:penicillin-binding protein 2
MYRSIVQSCDTYYYILANDLGVDAMHDFMVPFGLGQLTGIDMHGELRGTLPSTEWKRKAYRRKEQQKWYPGETISLGIGQGYNAFTMLQLAQAEATLAAGGQHFKPHLVHSIENTDTHQRRMLSGLALPTVPLKPEHVAVIHQALYGVTQEGTSARVFANAPYKSGGKTGTAQVIQIKQNEKYDASKIDERHRDHALYTAFAPLDAPRIALAIVVENGGFGASSAAPIARRVFDYVLQGLYPSPEDIAATQQGLSSAPIGVQRPVDSVVLPGEATGQVPPGAIIPAAAPAPAPALHQVALQPTRSPPAAPQR